MCINAFNMNNLTILITFINRVYAADLIKMQMFKHVNILIRPYGCHAIPMLSPDVLHFICIANMAFHILWSAAFVIVCVLGL